jgi:two-component system, OmpR family, KDP operon response regulator KdpE
MGLVAVSRQPEKGCRVLVADDDPDVRSFLSGCLSSAGYELMHAEPGESLGPAVAACRPDLVLTDVRTAGGDEIDAIRLVREWTSIPIIVLSGKSDERAMVAALDAGADDYMVRPVTADALRARIRAALRRSVVSGREVINIGDLRLDLAARRVAVSSREVALTPTEFELLKILAVQAGRVLTHRQLLREVWGITHHEDSHLVRVNVSNLRRKLEPEPHRPRFIITEPGVGYRLEQTV